MIKERKPIDKTGLFFLMIACSLIVWLFYIAFQDMRKLQAMEDRGQRVDKIMEEFKEKYKADCELRGGVPIDTKHVPKCVKKDAFI